MFRIFFPFVLKKRILCLSLMVVIVIYIYTKTYFLTFKYTQQAKKPNPLYVRNIYFKSPNTEISLEQ